MHISNIVVELNEGKKKKHSYEWEIYASFPSSYTVYEYC